MATLQRDMIQKGVFAIAIVAAVSTVGVVSFAKADTTGGSGSGYGTSSETQLAAANTFAASYVTDSNEWGVKVESYISTLKSQLASSTTLPADQFSSSFDAASEVYVSSTATALETFEANVQNAKNSGENKDQFIDSFNHAKADYFNSLEQAKNTLADQLNNLGNFNVVKDQFMNNYNDAKGVYGNQLEDAKNTFAATLG